MKTKNKEYYNEVINILVELKTLYPSHRVGQHLSGAFDEYGDIWGLSDKEILYALQKYKATLELNDVPRETNEEYINKIIKDAQNLNLSNILNNEEDVL